MDEKFIKSLEDALKINEFKYLSGQNYTSKNRIITFIHEHEKYSIFKPSKMSSMSINKFRKWAETKWNDEFTTVKYCEEPIVHVINMHEFLQKIINLPELVNYKLKGSYLENTLLVMKTSDELMNAVKYSKMFSKTLTRYLAEDLYKMHNVGIAYKDPSIYNVNISSTKGIVSFNNLIFTQPIEKIEDKARDIMQFLISIHYNSKKPVKELTQIFSIYYKGDYKSNSKEELLKAMKNVITYDITHISNNPIRAVYQRMAFGIGQKKMIELKNIILNNF